MIHGNLWIIGNVILSNLIIWDCKSCRVVFSFLLLWWCCKIFSNVSRRFPRLIDWNCNAPGGRDFLDFCWLWQQNRTYLDRFRSLVANPRTFHMDDSRSCRWRACFWQEWPSPRGMRFPLAKHDQAFIFPFGVNHTGIHWGDHQQGEFSRVIIEEHEEL